MKGAAVFKSFDGTGIAYYVAGNRKGMPIVLSNGLGGNIAAWMPMIEALKDRYLFITWDYRGLYKSDIPKNMRTMAVPYHMKDLELLLKKLRVRKALFVGWSMGVQVNFEFYKKHPEMFYGLVVLSGAAGYPFDTTKLLHGDVLRILVKLPAHLGSLIPDVIKFLTDRPYFFKIMKLSGIVAKTCSEKIFMDIVKDFRHLDFNAYFTMLDYLGEHSAEDALPLISCPTLIVVGGKDLFTPLPVAQKMHDNIQDSSLFILPKATHYAMAEYPREIIDEILKFIHKNRIDRHEREALPAAGNASQAIE